MSASPQADPLEVDPGEAAVEPQERSPAAVLAALRAGNRRYREGRGRHPHQAADDRAALVEEQRPIAAVLGCSDARVPVSVVLDQGLGDLFVVRVAGHALGDNVLASVHYAVEQLGVPVVLVLGHRGCGAVGLTVDAVRAGRDLSVPLLRDIAPAAQAAWAACPDDADDEARLCCANEDAVRRHAERTAERLRTDPVLARRIADGGLRVVPAVYDLASGGIDGL
jgi:carbonic anhydrase